MSAAHGTLVLGVDFTSAPTRAKPIACLGCEFGDGVLRAGELLELDSFERFEALLARPRTAGGIVALPPPSPSRSP